MSNLSLSPTHPSLSKTRHDPSAESFAAAEESVDLALGRLVQEVLAEKRENVYCRIQKILDRIVLREVLQYVKGSQVEAADLLGISRTTLRSKLRRLGLAIEKEVKAAPGNWEPVVRASG